MRAGKKSVGVEGKQICNRERRELSLKYCKNIQNMGVNISSIKCRKEGLELEMQKILKYCKNMPQNTQNINLLLKKRLSPKPIYPMVQIQDYQLKH